MERKEKVDYVKRQADTGNHHCHYPGCGKKCKPAYWGCYACWMKLPKYLRDKIWAAYKPGQEVSKLPSREYVQAAREVQEWCETNEKKPKSDTPLFG